MANIIMAKGKDLKVIKSFITHNGEKKEGDINDYLAGNNKTAVGGANSLSKGVEEASKPKEFQKICLGCSSPAKEGLDYCGSCWILVNRPK